MGKNKKGAPTSSQLLRKFYVLYAGFALVPYVIFFVLHSQYGHGPYRTAVSKNHLGVFMILIGLACLIGFFAMRASLMKIARLADELKEGALKQMDHDTVMQLAKEKGEVGELARSFGNIFGRLEDNINELEETRQTLHSVLANVSRVLSSSDNLNILVRLILETTASALKATQGAIFSSVDGQQFEVRALVGIEGREDDEVVQAASQFLHAVAENHQVFVLPALGTGDEAGDAPLFAAPVVCSPLMSRGKLLGAVCLSGRASGANFAESELTLISNLAQQIAISFENMQMSENMERTYLETVSALAMAVEARDAYSRGHSDRVGRYGQEIGASLGLSDEDLQTLRDASRLHDIGKIGIADNILGKPGRLTTDERNVMMEHPSIGETIVTPLKTFHHLLDPIRHHHEFLDGSGYPDGLSADDVPIVSRIMGVTDIYDALTSDRPYRKSMSVEEAREVLDSMADEGKVDPEVVTALFELVEQGRIPRSAPGPG